MNLRDILRSGPGRYELRATGIGETTNGGADLVRPDFATDVFKLVREYSAILADAKLIETPTGAPYGFPQWSAFTATGSATAEAATAPDGSPGASTPLVAFSLEQFGTAPTYAAQAPVSLQLIADGLDVEDTVTAALAEAIGRQVASVASSALYGSATAGQEVSIGTVTVDNVAKLLGLIDPATSPSLYVSPADYALLAASDPTGLRHLADLVPGGLKVTNAATAYASGTVSGPVLADLSRVLLLRQGGPLQVSVNLEAVGGAEDLSYVVLAAGRYDVKVSGQTTGAVFAK